MSPGLEMAPARSSSVAEATPAVASSNLVRVAGAEQPQHRYCGTQVENCQQGPAKPLAFSWAHSPQWLAAKLLGPPSREFDQSVFGPPRSPLTRDAPELLRYSK